MTLTLPEAMNPTCTHPVMQSVQGQPEGSTKRHLERISVTCETFAPIFGLVSKLDNKIIATASLFVKVFCADQ